MRKLFLHIKLWWHQLPNDVKAALKEAGECVLMFVAIVAMMILFFFLPYLLSDYLPKN